MEYPPWRYLSIGSPLGKIKIYGDITAHLEVAKGVFDTANELGAKNIRMFSFYLPEGKTREECKGQIYDGTFTGTLTAGDGVTAELLLKNGITVYTESEILNIL